MKDKISKFFNTIKNWVRTDGLLHIVVSALICVMLGWINPIWIAPLVTLLIGIGKEIYDKVSKKGTAEWHDLICDIIGIVIGMLCILPYIL